MRLLRRVGTLQPSLFGTATVSFAKIRDAAFQQG